MNILFTIFAAIYAALGFSTLWMPLVSAFFFFVFAIALVKAITHREDIPVKVYSRANHKK